MWIPRRIASAAPPPGIVAYCLACLCALSCGGGGEKITATVPVISSFTARPSTVTVGESTTLSWSVSGASAVSLDNGVGMVSGGSRTVSPGGSTTYTLTATSSAGSVTASVTVTVVPAAHIASFVAAPAAITADQGTTLTWIVTDATSAMIDNGIGAVTGTSVDVMPAATTTYTLTATNSLGTAVRAAVTVTVAAGVGGVTLTWNAGSTVKLEQVVGDVDWADLAHGVTTPTASRTVTRYHVLGSGYGYSFEDNGKVVFMFGDTESEDPVNINYHAQDPIAWSTVTDGEAPLVLNYFTQSPGVPLFMAPPGIRMGADDICNSGITLPDGTYMVCNTGADVMDPTLTDPHANSYSVLVKFDEAAHAFTGGRTVSDTHGGHFVYTSMHADGADVYMYGMGQYRASDVFLSKTPAATFWAGSGTQYFTGIVNGQPTWSSSEGDAVPVIQDNPVGGPPWPGDDPTVGNLSVGWCPELGLWLATFDGGRQTNATRGVYFTYAQHPWGPWATPQLIFNIVRDGAWGVYVHNPDAVPNDGLNGPIIGANNPANDPVTTAGAAFAPLLIERFTTVAENDVRIYFMVSTWNPYTVVKMRSEFTRSHP